MNEIHGRSGADKRTDRYINMNGTDLKPQPILYCVRQRTNRYKFFANVTGRDICRLTNTVAFTSEVKLTKI